MNQSEINIKNVINYIYTEEILFCKKILIQ